MWAKAEVLENKLEKSKFGCLTHGSNINIVADHTCKQTTKNTHILAEYNVILIISEVLWCIDLYEEY
jgi:hypothetical protein